MKKSRILALTSALVLVAAIGIGGTYSYFTDTKTTPNDLTMGQVKISIFETDEKGNKDEDGLKFTDLEPGQVVSKDPTVEVDSNSADCYVRLKMEIKPTDKNGIPQEELDKIMVYEFGAPDDLDAVAQKTFYDNGRIVLKEGWTGNADGYYYYGSKCAAKTETQFFDEVVLPTTWTEMVTADKSFEIVITAEAIQADYLEDGILELKDGRVIGWNKDKVDELFDLKDTTTSADGE